MVHTSLLVFVGGSQYLQFNMQRGDDSAGEVTASLAVTETTAYPSARRFTQNTPSPRRKGILDIDRQGAARIIRLSILIIDVLGNSRYKHHVQLRNSPVSWVRHLPHTRVLSDVLPDA